ncbi:hypothetical protein [Sphingobacterium mizutaii]|uniref:hypothetical protein n=1 Tax=Sphingobacterium mizutaii TaxID=1010 RepID=UPI00289FE2F6|nr:hypothetical protein [Sphingobacterium mizutaii]
MATIRKNVLSSLIGNLVYAFGQYLILILFIKLFTKAEVGEYLFALAFVTPINLGFDLQLRTLYVTESNKNISFSDYYTFRWITNILSILISVIAIVFYKSEYFLIVLVVSLIKAIETHLELIYGVYQSNFRLDFVAKSKIIRTVVSLIVVSLIVFLFKNLAIGLISYLAIWILLLFFYEKESVLDLGFLKQSDFKIQINAQNIKYLIYNSAPLFFAIIIDKYYANYPRLAIEKYLGLNDLAIFGSLLYFKTLAGQIISAIGQATAPNLSLFFREQKYKLFNRLVWKLIFAGFFVGLLGVFIVYFLGEWILSIVYNQEYAVYKNILLLILIGASISFSYIFIGTALTCMRKQWVKLPISIIGFSLLVLFFAFKSPQDLETVAKFLLYIEGLIFTLYFIIYLYYLNYDIKKIVKKNLPGISD